MNINPKIRLFIYIFTGVGSILVAYFSNRGNISVNEIELWTALSAFVNGLAAVNVNPEK